MMLEKKVRLLDSQFAKFLANRSGLTGQERDQFQDIVCRLSISLGGGDSCLPVTDSEAKLVSSTALAREGESEGANKPLCLAGNRLYLQRMFAYEQTLAAGIGKIVSDSRKLSLNELLLDSLFGSQQDHDTDYQRLAAVQALEQNLLIISGGPGTGKTTTVVKILALLQDASGGRLKVALAAPTGKAAMRLQESIGNSVRGLVSGHATVKNIPEQASTLHRLLGVKQHSPFFYHNAENPLSCDVVVVDEASMVDLALMSKLVSALRPGCRLILLGDKDQLASVESGTVLADMITALPGNTVELQRSYRFDRGIKGFAEAVNRGDSLLAWDLMVADSPENVSLLDTDVASYGGRRYSDYMEGVRNAGTIEDYRKLFEMFHSFKILCALRHGPSGVQGVNRGVEKYLSTKGYDCTTAEWYPGRPVMVTRNEYGLDLYNGDIGLCLPDPANSQILKVWFERADGILRGLLPGRLSSCETVYALTIHKSQGAEIGEVLVVLPDRESAIVTRELLYTAVTRARDRVKVKSIRSVFDLAVAGKIKRHSGLAACLRGEDLFTG